MLFFFKDVSNCQTTNDQYYCVPTKWCSISLGQFCHSKNITSSAWKNALRSMLRPLVCLRTSSKRLKRNGWAMGYISTATSKHIHFQICSDMFRTSVFVLQYFLFFGALSSSQIVTGRVSTSWGAAVTELQWLMQWQKSKLTGFI